MLRIKILVKAKTEVLEDGKGVFLLLSEGLKKIQSTSQSQSGDTTRVAFQ